MAHSAQAYERLFSRYKIQSFDHDPNTTSATVVTASAYDTKALVTMSGHAAFAAVAMNSTLTGNGITIMQIVSAENATQKNTRVVKSANFAYTAVGDYCVLEVQAEQIKADNKSATHVGVRLTLANAADEAVVTYIRGPARYAYTGLTANVDCSAVGPVG